MNNIKNIVLDFGGVILTDDDVGVLFDNDELINKFNTSWQVFADAWDRDWRLVGEDKIGIIDYYSKLQEEAIGSSDVIFSKKLFEIYKQKTKTLDAFNLLPKLKENYNLFALTNIFKEGLEFKRKKYNLDNIFSTIIASCDFQVSKPEPEIYKILIESTKLIPEETLFVDDREKNTKAAEKIGFKTHLYTGITSLKRELEKLGITYE